MKLELRQITKKFPAVLANDRISLSVEPGEVHVLLGENGAGKSTLMNVLYGLYRPDEGEILVDGRQVHFESPSDAIRAGIGMIHQHFMLIPVFTVAENVMLGTEITGRLGFLDRRRARQAVESLEREFGLAVEPEARIESLSVGAQQRVEILKALYRQATGLILDEPTAVLTPQETSELFRVMRSLAEAGRSIVFITHKLREAMEVADRITVLRQGRVVGTTVPASTSEAELAAMMVGRAVQLTVDRPPSKPGGAVLEVSGLTVLDDRRQIAVDSVDLVVRAGEIVTVAGVQGNGQTELVRALTGLATVASGSVRVGGQDLTHASPRKVMSAGVGHVPEDRQRDGMVGDLSVAENMALDTYFRPPFARGFVLDPARMRKAALNLIGDFDVRTPSPDVPASKLSGGNQQRMIVAREFSRRVRLLIASQPTRGLDVGSIQYIHSQLVHIRDEGTAVLLVSSDLDEVLALGDRIAVMFRGRLVGPFESAALGRERIGLMMAGAADPAVAGAGRAPESG
ncbi:MAG: ABC transporter ATP-binding protein [Candidatus Dormibacterales bacterium]